MTTTKPATPLPWVVSDAIICPDEADEDQAAQAWIADCRTPKGDQNAAYIVHACNAYPELVAALRLVALNGMDSAINHWPGRVCAEAARALLAKLGESETTKETA